MKKAIYPGSFDPVTYGHLDIIERSAKMADELVVGVLMNNAKRPMFTVEERLEMLREETKHLPNVKVQAFDGLLVDFVREIDASVIVRGLRAVTDFEYELQMAQTNRKIAPDLDTIFLTTDLRYAYLSSSIVKEVAYWQGDISAFVPPAVAERIRERVCEMKK
ncbi:MAG: pantetheine-phosphate adenylyltransferase [Lachnospiraceae bacterium]|nr:pantetheine-phosphate adenylyltransferase [Lachnospiraceae bacterium]